MSRKRSEMIVFGHTNLGAQLLIATSPAPRRVIRGNFSK
jgi:hypothetical protein